MVRKTVIAATMLAVFCGQAFGGDVTESVKTSDGRSRTYLIHTPPNYDGETPLPLLIALHYGGYEQGQGMANVTRLSEKADEEGFIAVYPNALSPGWTDWDALFLDELVDTLSSRYAIDSSRRFMTGYSAGALMTHWMACELSDRIAAFTPVAGTMLTYDWAGCYPVRSPSIVSINARNDPVMTYEGDGEYYMGVEEAMSNWAERLECDEGPDSFYDSNGALRQTWSRSDDKCDIVLWTTEGGGHSWPTLTGPHKLSANDVMWEFFVAHPLPAEEPGVQEPVRPEFALDPLNPSIFTNSATIRFSLDEAEQVSLKLFDVQGREMVTLLNEGLSPGEHEVVIDRNKLPSGVYFYRVVTARFAETKSIIFLR